MSDDQRRAEAARMALRLCEMMNLGDDDDDDDGEDDDSEV